MSMETTGLGTVQGGDESMGAAASHSNKGYGGRMTTSHALPMMPMKTGLVQSTPPVHHGRQKSHRQSSSSTTDDSMDNRSDIHSSSESEEN